ncbi:MAG: AI-2E family transporter [Archangiaceae bacterium]|nr:AI-2E family transporter [Archangiaceae bacterium]
MSDKEPAHHIVHSRFYARTFGLVTAAVVGYLFFRVLQPFLSQVIWAALLGAILQPLHRQLTRRLNNRPSASSAIISFGGALGIIVPAGLLATLFTRQASQLLGRIQNAASLRHIEGLPDVMALPIVKAWVERMQDVAGVQSEQVIDWATAGAERTIQFLVQASGSFFVGALGVVGNFFFVVVFLFFFLRDGEKAIDTVAHLIPMPSNRRHQLFETLSNTAQAVVLGTLLTAGVQGILTGIGFAMAGLPSAIVFGVLAMIASPIPFVGTALVWLPGALALFAQGHTGWGVFMLLWGVLVVSMVDNILRPLLISGRSGAPTLLVFAGVLGGLGAFGTVGLFVGPLILTLVVALIRYADEVAKEREGLPEPRPSVSPPAPAPVAPAALRPAPPVVEPAAPATGKEIAEKPAG